MDKRAWYAIGILVLIFGVILAYEWSGEWRGYKRTLEQHKVITQEILKEEKVPLYAVVFITTIDYIKRSWLCLLLAFIAAGAIQEFVPRDKMINIMGSKRGILPYVISGLGGPLLSMCSCSIIPLFGGLYKRGAALGPSLTFLLVAPAFNPAALFLTLGLLGWKFTVARAIVAILSGTAVGYITEKVMENRIKPPEPMHIDAGTTGMPDAENFGRRIINMLMYSWEFVKLVLPLVLFGVVLAGLIKTFLPPAFIVKFLGVGILPIALASIIGVIMYVPSIVEAPLIKGLLESGMGTGAAMAHLLTGPALSLPSILGVCKIVNWRIPLFYSILMWICGIIGGIIFSLLVPVF